MKTTLDLPEPLVREMKLWAAQEGRKLKDVATEVFRAGLRAPSQSRETKAYRQTLDTPLFACEAAKANAPSMTVAELLRLEQSAQVQEDLTRVGSTL
ncbi:MAG: antitoxin [Opitutaceae bacterium]